MHRVCFDWHVDITVGGVMQIQLNRMIVFIEHNHDCARVGPLEHSYLNMLRVLVVSYMLESNRILYQKFAKMSHCIENGLLIVFLAGRVDDNGSIDVVTNPVGTPLQVEHKVPVNPTTCMMI